MSAIARARTGEARPLPMGLDAAQPGAFRWGPDGQRYFTATLDAVYVWRANPRLVHVLIAVRSLTNLSISAPWLLC